MNKQEMAVVALLFVLLLGWGFFQRKYLAPPPRPAQEQPAEPAPAAPISPVEPVPPGTTPVPVEPIVEASPAAAGAETATGVAGAQPLGEEATARRMLPEETVVLSNEVASVSISSWGGAVSTVTLGDYLARLPSKDEPDPGRVQLDFHGRPALSLRGIPGLSTNSDFVLRRAASGREVSVERETEGGLRFRRTLRLAEHYRLEVIDEFRNVNDLPVALPEHGVALGMARMVESKAKTRGYSYLGVDVLPDVGGASVVYWRSKELMGVLGARSTGLSCAGPDAASLQPSGFKPVGRPVTWAAAKNKFFVQILAPAGGASDCEVFAALDPEGGKAPVISTVSATLLFPRALLQPGEEFSREMSYYVGPKKYSVLKTLAQHQDQVMLRAWRGWGWFRYVCIGLLAGLNAIYAAVPSYGVAIIVLTVIVKILFWPFTHKSTESMKKMQTVQPQLAELKEKFKNSPQKLQQAQMALYKEHGINPMASCLPMVFQMPVFIALFTVLRSAVELRFAPFLWIGDLSEPEGLLEGMLPVVGSLNILPLLMTATMVWQQKLTPSTGDAQQQRMMTMFMPVFLLFIMYKMPSALTLYWTVSQCLSIGQLMLQKRRKG